MILITASYDIAPEEYEKTSLLFALLPEMTGSDCGGAAAMVRKFPQKYKEDVAMYEAIMLEITNGLTGDPVRDRRYLMEQARKYQDHEMGQEIVSACGRMMFDLIPRENSEELNRIVQEKQKDIQKKYNEIGDLMSQKKVDQAIMVSARLIEELEENPIFQSDAIGTYYNFDDYFEKMLFFQYNRPEEMPPETPIPFSTIYFRHGCLLFEMQKYEQAKAFLAKAKTWNPASAKIAFEYLETLKALGELGEFAKLTKKTFLYAYRPQDVARCYRNLGYYFVEKKLYKVAVGCYFLSLNFEPQNKAAESELHYIYTTLGPKFEKPTLQECSKYGEQYSFPTTICDDILGVAASASQIFEQRGDKEKAIRCLEIYYDLTKSEEAKKLIQTIRDSMGRKKSWWGGR